MFPALVRFYFAVDSITSVRLFNLCGLILLVASIAVYIDLSIVSHFCLSVLCPLVWLIPGYTEESGCI